MYGYGALNGQSRRPGMVASFPRFKPWKYSDSSLEAEVPEALKYQKRNLGSRSGQRGLWSMKSKERLRDLKSRKEARARGHAARNPLKVHYSGANACLETGRVCLPSRLEDEVPRGKGHCQRTHTLHMVGL